jgi:nicotinamide-nucleotide amidase
MGAISDAWLDLAAALGERCMASGAIIAGAESCTGGLVAASITAVSGSSAWFDRGFVTYSNDAKTELLGVSAHNLEHFGAVSEETAAEMALGALRRSNATHSFSVTGVAGPTGGSATKPVGTVCFGFASARGADTLTKHFGGDRAAVREASVRFVLMELATRVTDEARRATR